MQSRHLVLGIPILPESQSINERSRFWDKVN
jgi:hypothetical protein